ncbi:putative membrane protein YphA (DoxX/SURF4 family) [Chryseobacterium rhizosphaerae]|uniref:MauE/DoxX family redox-associated membrane protein n=1 Tax=Chryseobacterium rhizosphaerae TaxID=395937 RepID=UPI00285C990F|nr:MauE/DoxX family redox-associated membrane protein [Chryseobacterium rhizosphaerae]MDR6546514.1 putative membrane protein YphA (DoxX/SURF4 family) [Chryseobacterium rhizosphaerae]
MKLIKYIKKQFVWIVSILMAFLFIYAAASKWMDFENFQVQLAQSPLLSAYAGFISYGVIIVEFVLAICLCLPNTQKMALYGSLGLMSAFTFYIHTILHYSDFIPCSCGGILEKLGWTEHLIFNLFFVFLAFAAILYKERKENPNSKLFRPVWIAIACVAMSSGVVLVLFLRSEHIIKKENNFTRRFLQHPVMEDKNIDLGVNSYYFAGIVDGIIYLGNITAPLLMTKVDTNLQKVSQTKIEIDAKNHPFRSVQLQVKRPYYYLHDGSVPVIFRGKLGDSLASTLSYGDAFFNQLTVLDSMRFALRTQRRTDNQYTLALLDLNKEPKIALKTNVLEKQIDGVFDVDGLLASDPTKGTIAYTYFYRNQFILMDSALNVLNRFNTIDTTRIAKISITKLSDGKIKMNAPPFSVNKGYALHENLLFNRSNLKGKHEPAESWKSSSIIDVYRTDEQRYIGSFYIRNKNGKGMSSMLIDGPYLYVLVDQELQRYRIRAGAFK